MAIVSAALTEREKASLWYHIFGGCDDWQTLFKIADDRPYNEIGGRWFNSVVSKWKHSDKVQNYLEELRKIQALQEHQLKEDARKEMEMEMEKGGDGESKERTQKRKTNLIDYNDPQERKRAYNRIIQDSADDPKTQLDALKVFEQLQRDDKQAAKDNQIQRFYTPLKCHSCPLWLKHTK